jgi:hypothetical protein
MRRAVTLGPASGKSLSKIHGSTVSARTEGRAEAGCN